MLYPIKFRPLYKERIWGGRKLETSFAKQLPEGKLIGESWELSGVAGDLSVAAEGPLKGNSLQELTEIYMGDLVGEKIFERYGEEFPLLIKLIDAADNLSIQVHPDDRLAAERHNAYGKTEMWYVLDHEPGAQLYVGFNQPVDRQKYLDYLAQGRLAELLQAYPVKKGDAFFIPAGTIHAIGTGMLIAEIQQTSDITYRVFDWNRIDAATGKGRELHTELALDAIDFAPHTPSDYLIRTHAKPNEPATIKECPYFHTNALSVHGTCERSYLPLDSFVILICLDGELLVEYEGGKLALTQGETLLIPAAISGVTLTGTAQLLETYVP